MTITALGNSVLFQFNDAINTRNEFVKGQTDSGIILAGDQFDSSAKESRFVTVRYVGPDVKTMKPGYMALVPALRWTEGVKVEGEKLWKTDEKEVVAVESNNDGSSLKPIANWILFEIQPRENVRSHGLLMIVGGVNNSASGKVLSVGPDAKAASVDDLTGATIFYDDSNFTNTIKYRGKTIAFIKDTDILAYTLQGE